MRRMYCYIVFFSRKVSSDCGGHRRSNVFSHFLGNQRQLKFIIYMKKFSLLFILSYFFSHETQKDQSSILYCLLFSLSFFKFIFRFFVL